MGLTPDAARALADKLQDCVDLSPPDPATGIQRMLDALDRDAAFKPYWPEMLDFTLPENAQAELDELDAYRAGFAPDPA